MSPRFRRAGRIAAAIALVALAAFVVGAVRSPSEGSVAAYRQDRSDRSSSRRPGSRTKAPTPRWPRRKRRSGRIRQLPSRRRDLELAVHVRPTSGATTGLGLWQSIGPNQASTAVLDQFLAGGKPYTASGRDRARDRRLQAREPVLAVPRAAGGGVWVADKATDGDGNVHWQFKSGSFGTNAIGSLLVDPSDQSGNTVTRAPASRTPPVTRRQAWASTSRPTAVTAGPSWRAAMSSRPLDPSLALDSAGNLLVGVAAASGVSAPSPAARPRTRPFGGARLLPPDRRDVHADLNGGGRPRPERGHGRPEHIRRPSTRGVPGRRLALAGQRSHLGADQAGAQPGSQH